MTDPAPRPTADEEWNTLLRHWRARQNQQPRPFFYSRVRARLVQETAAAPFALRAWLRWPSYAVLLGIILLLSGDVAGVRATESISRYQLPPGALPIPATAR